MTKSWQPVESRGPRIRSPFLDHVADNQAKGFGVADKTMPGFKAEKIHTNRANRAALGAERADHFGECLFSEESRLQSDLGALIPRFQVASRDAYKTRAHRAGKVTKTGAIKCQAPLCGRTSMSRRQQRAETSISSRKR